jgi:hypothetical protein
MMGGGLQRYRATNEKKKKGKERKKKKNGRRFRKLTATFTLRQIGLVSKAKTICNNRRYTAFANRAYITRKPHSKGKMYIRRVVGKGGGKGKSLQHNRYLRMLCKLNLYRWNKIK